MNRTLHWFRSDLRTHDNLALSAAQAAGTVIGLYIATPQQWRMHHDAPIKQDYWRRNLHTLADELRALGIPLVYVEVPAYADIAPMLGQLMALWQVGALYCNREYACNEAARDEGVRKVCGELGVTMHVHDDHVLMAPERVLNKSGEPFKVFTPFARTLRALLQQSGVAQAARLRRQDPPLLAIAPGQRALHELSWAVPDARWENLWPAGTDTAQQQLTAFCETRIGSYGTLRDIPSVNGTSRLSPALAAGVISVRECWRRAMQWDDSAGALAWQNELLWRDFYKGVMTHFPRVCKGFPWRNDVGHVPWRHDEQEFATWCEGRTGIPIIDAAMRQLLHTGWMHNRLRMLTATFLSKHLLIDWRWGERWFMQQLIDGDFASNNGGWQWCASTGTDAAPYFRVFNPVTQSRRFDADGKFIRQWLPELAALEDREIHEPKAARPTEYPPAIVDLAFGRERALNAFGNREH
ncbi:MAG: cryptochrome/photolyase family protein [Gammaproteobacteria bacterium]